MSLGSDSIMILILRTVLVAVLFILGSQRRLTAGTASMTELFASKTF